jgi:O-antigen ligase
MLILAFVFWRSREFQDDNPYLTDFLALLAPISRSSFVFWLILVFSAVVSFVISEQAELKPLINSLGNFFVKYVLLWFAYLSFWWRVRASDRTWIIFSRSYALFSAVNAIYCLIQRQTGVDWAHGLGHFLGEHRFAYGVYRVSGFMGHPLTFGYCQVLALVSSLFLFSVSERREEKIAWFIAFTSAFFVLLISGSRGPQLVAIIGSVLLMPLTFWKNRWKELGVALAILLALGWQIGFFDRFVELFSQGSGGDIRAIHWSVHWQIFRDHFWFGIGPGTPKSAISAYYFALQANDNIRLAHNTFLQCAAEFGVLGLLGMCIWLLAWVHVGFRSSKSRRVLFVVFVVTALSGLTQNNLQDSAFVLGLTTWTMILASYEVSRRVSNFGTVKNSDNLSREGGAPP